MGMTEKRVDMKAIGFDLDDTLYNRLTIYEKTFQDMQANGRKEAYALDVDFESFNAVYADFSEREYRAFMAGEKTEQAFKNDRVIKTYAHFGKTIDLSLAKEFNRLKNDHQQQLTLSDDLVALFEAAMAKGLTTFVLTNGSTKAQIDKLNSLEIWRYVEPKNWFISDSLNASKPDRAVFDIVAENLEIEGKDIVFVGDDYKNDVEGAIQAGWQAIHYASQEWPDTLATCTTDDFLEMRTLLANL